MQQSKALVVGATGGMGSSIAIGLAGAGFDCALMGRNEEAVNKVTNQCTEVGAKAYLSFVTSPNSQPSKLP